MIPGSANPLLLKSAAAAGYQIERSLRFNSSDSAYLSRTPASAGNRKTWTWAGWVKRSKFGGYAYLLSTGSDNTGIRFDPSTNRLELFDYPGSYAWQLLTTQVFRDPSAWFHVVIALDTTQATASNRLKLYINGAQVTAFDTSSYPSQNYEGPINNNTSQAIGLGVAGYFDGYLADIYFIDGQALTPSSFTEVSATTGQLIPKAYTGSFGTNGFWLKFSDNSNNTATTLGKDYSGNSNNWTPNNFAVLDGNGNYLQGWTASSGFYGVYTVNRGFDGIYGPTLNEMALTLGTSMTWAPSTSVSTGSSFRIFTYPAGGYNSGYIVTVGAVSQTVATSPTLGEWMDLTSLTGLTINTSTPLVITTNGGSRAGFSAIEINGVILLDDGVVGPTNDSLVDTPTSSGVDTSAGGEVRGNYATFNPTESSTSGAKTLTNGNLDVLLADANAARLTIPPIQGSGKYQWEITIGSKTATYYQMGLNLLSMVYATGDLHATFRSDGNLSNTLSGSWSGTGVSYTSGDVITVTYDNATNACAFYKNGVYSATFTVSGTPQASLNFGVFYGGSGNTNYTLNAGQRPFAYTAPSGFKALCDTNLPTPVVAKPNTVMDVVLYTGNGSSSRSVSGLNFSPDLVWLKARSFAPSHHLFDTIRGATKFLGSDTTNAEQTGSDRLTAFDSAGFTLGSNAEVNQNGSTYVAWAWDAGTSTVTNTQGSITSQVRANASAGFSVVSWTAGTAPVTIGHGLGVAPQFIIIKSRTSGAVGWQIGHVSLGWTKRLFFDTAAADTTTAAWNDTSPTSTVFTIGSTGYQTGNMIAYCFAPVVGYSNAFTYSGNGSTDGPFCFLGFRPRLILLKVSNTTGGWYLFDTARNTYNVMNNRLEANSASAEASDRNVVDALSNGFKLRDVDAVWNQNGNTYIGFAWAENPFQYARAR